MEKRLKAKVKTDCLMCGWIHEWEVKGDTEEEIAEELIDVIFYVLDASRLACPNVNMDKMFLKKLEKNRKRSYQYGEGQYPS